MAEVSDELFVYADGLLEEGKALGTADPFHLVLAQDMSSVKDADPSAFAQRRRYGADVGRRVLARTQEETREEMLMTFRAFQGKKITERGLRRYMTEAMKSAWRKVFLAGLRAGGVPGTGAGGGDSPLVGLTAHDERWIKSAMQHEMRFLNKMVKAILEGTYRMPLERRINMYVDALQSFYESARVIGLPLTTEIRWHGPSDKRTCLGCQYLFEHSPYTKITLPTTPRSGLTPCLTNCRDRLWIRRVGPEEAQKITEGSQFPRAKHIENLRTIKRTGHL